MKHTIDELRLLQNLPLDIKVFKTKQRIREWYEYWNGDVYVSFSGGKDSTVLLALARMVYPDIPAVFINTGLEYYEIQKFVKTFDNVEILTPSMSFTDVIKTYGYPVVSKEVSESVDQGRKCLERNDGKYTYRLLKLQGKLLDKDGNPSKYNLKKWEPLLYTDFRISANCCNIMKKRPAKQYTKQTGRKPITAQTADESRLRTEQWLRNSCNGFEMKAPISNPMAFWTEQDVLEFIYKYNLEIASVYGDVVCNDGVYSTTGVKRTGCLFCMYGCHLEAEPNRFQMLKQTHPKQYNYCINGGEYVDGFWQPNKEGLGLAKVLDYLGVKYE